MADRLASVVWSLVGIQVLLEVYSLLMLSKSKPSIYPSLSSSQKLILLIRKYGLAGLEPVAAANLSANIVSTLQIAAFAGALVATWFADRFGRRPALLITSFVITVGVILQAASDGHLACMYVGRCVHCSLQFQDSLNR